jgi:beta-aspartyl-peptidase (threonine type)
MTHLSLQQGLPSVLAGVALLCMSLALTSHVAAQSTAPDKVAIVVHGGAGTILPENITDEQEQAYRAALRTALETGHSVLTGGGSSIDAVVAALQTMEDSPLFNAGKGAVFTSENTVELDASLMDGETLNAGALTGVKHIKNPIGLARLIMEESPHVMMAGTGAEAFARDHDVEFVENEYFYTERRRQQAEEARSDDPEEDAPDDDAERNDRPDYEKFGTVGAVALDRNGNLAAGTTTGGMTNKRFGRVGDSPIIGAGTYADNATCGVSATGHGEYFIRAAVAHDISARMKHGGMSVHDAAHAVIMDELPTMEPEGGSGGVIAMDADGNIAMPFNTPGMYRGYVDTDGNMVVRIYRPENDE